MGRSERYRKILQEQGIQLPDRGIQLSIRCPLHNDKTPSCSINLEKNVWICHAGCGEGRLSSLLSRFLGISLIEAALYLRGPLDELDFDLTFDEESLDDDFDLPEVNFPFNGTNFPEWVYNRGLEKALLLKWECRYNQDFDSLIIPIKHYTKRTIGWICRQGPGREPRYLYFPEQVNVSKTLFGLYNLIDAEKIDLLCITEGPIDTLWLSQNGYSSVAVFGTHISRRQEELFEKLRVNEICVCFDNDEAGKEALRTQCKELCKKNVVTYIKIPIPYKDVNDIRQLNKLHDVIQNRNLLFT